MPFEASLSTRPLDVAVIGTGISGLSAAWLLSRAHRITVYEAEARIGGHSHTVDVDGPDGPIAVDTGFIVYNELNYPNLTALFAHLGVETQASDMSFAASLRNGDVEYSGTGLAGLFAQRRNLFRPRFWRMLNGLRRFYRDSAQVLAQHDADGLTLGAYLGREGYDEAFINDHLLPMAAAVWSSPVADMRDQPAAAFVRFNLNHGLMRFSGRPQWRTVTGGSRAYVAKLTAPFVDRIIVEAPIRSVTRSAGAVTVVDVHGQRARHDHVVIGTHADQALAMLADPSPDERRLLGSFPYTTNRAVLHRDPALMPRRRAVWSSWNYLSSDLDQERQVCVTYWMNRLQSLDPRAPLFVTLNPIREPEPHLLERSLGYAHPGYDLAALRAQRALWDLQGDRNTWFCGSYFGAGFHEDGAQSGLAVAEALGGVRRPWTVPGESERLPCLAAQSPVLAAAA